MLAARLLPFRAPFVRLMSSKSLATVDEYAMTVRPDKAHYNAELAQVSVPGGVKEEVDGRKAIIYRACKSAMTSGRANENWMVRFDHTDKWSNPLMGWLSAADTMTQLPNHLAYETKEEAVRVAERNGWQYEVLEPVEKNTDIVKSYSFNFLPEPVDARLKDVGPRKGRDLFAHETKHGSHWINRKHTTFGNNEWTPEK